MKKVIAIQVLPKKFVPQSIITIGGLTLIKIIIIIIHFIFTLF